jgi:NADH:ubiquinone oxidoreductase subunit C
MALFVNSDWYEREVWDLFGVRSLNPNLRRILTDYGFVGHPLRKDFPLVGYEEARYNEIEGCIVSETVSTFDEFYDSEVVPQWRKNPLF